MKVGAKSSRETSREAVETDFGPQDNGFGGQEGDFGGQNGGPLFTMRTFGQRSVEWRRPLAKLEYDEYSLEYRTVPYAGHPEGCGGL